jgi:hypothetical protein
MMVQQHFSSSHASCDMLVGFSFGATRHGFAGAFAAFAGALFFDGMVAARVLRGVNCMGATDEATGGRNEQLYGRGIPLKIVGFGFM